MIYVRGAGVHCIMPRSLKRPTSFSSVSISFVSLAGMLLPMEGLLASRNRVMYLVGPRFRTKERGIKGGKIMESPTIRRRIVRGIHSCTVDVFVRPYRLSFSPVGKPRKGVRCLLRLGGRPRNAKIASDLGMSMRTIITRTRKRLSWGN